MKVTKYPQSCLLVEEDSARVVVDPGMHFASQYQLSELGELNAVLYTHQHPDHFEQSLVEGFLAAGVQLVANRSTAELIDGEVTVVDDGNQLTIAGLDVIARELPHCLMHDGSPGPQNTGYTINGALFHPGDGDSIENLQVENLATPIAGPSVSPKTAYDLVRQVDASTVIPIHYDYWKQDPEVIKQKFEAEDLKVIVLDNGQSAEL